jgi:HEPN domain-containing protein
MQDVVREWVEKAEGDFVTALREWRARKKRNPDAICFHAQQCVEKYLKALLQKDRTPFPKTHDLVILSKASLSKHPFLGPELSNMDTLSRFAVLFRYPGESAKTADAMAAVRLMKTYRAALRQALDLSEHEPN